MAYTRLPGSTLLPIHSWPNSNTQSTNMYLYGVLRLAWSQYTMVRAYIHSCGNKTRCVITADFQGSIDQRVLCSVPLRPSLQSIAASLQLPYMWCGREQPLRPLAYQAGDRHTSYTVPCTALCSRRTDPLETFKSIAI